MNLSDFQFTPTLTFPEHSILYRVQRGRSPRGTVSIGSIRVPSRGLLLNRFDLIDDEVGYFAEAPETAVYETLARREALQLSYSELGRRVFLILRAIRPLKLLDLRHHANGYPVLQSLRFPVTQNIAAQVQRAGYEGIAYRSAQHFGAGCLSLNGDAMRALRLVSKRPLLEPGTGGVHRAVAVAILGSQIQLVP